MVKSFGIFLAVYSLTVPAFGLPIEFIQTGTGSGTLGTTTFTDAAFTITSFGDTNNRREDIDHDAATTIIDNDSSNIEIDGLGTFQVQSFTNIYVSRDVASAGYEYDLSRGYDDDDLYDTDSNTAFSTWDMSTSIGPVSVNSQLLQWDCLIFRVYVGSDTVRLIFNDQDVPGTFQAIVVPEPSTFQILFLGGLVLGSVLLRAPTRNKKAQACT